MARFVDQRQIGQQHIVVRRARRGLVGAQRWEAVGRDRRAWRVATSRPCPGSPTAPRSPTGWRWPSPRPRNSRARADRRTAPKHERMAGRADLLIHLEAALQLLAGRTCPEGPSNSNEWSPSDAMGFLLGGRLRRPGGSEQQLITRARKTLAKHLGHVISLVHEFAQLVRPCSGVVDATAQASEIDYGTGSGRSG